MMLAFVLVVFGLNLVSLFVDTPMWYTVVMGIITAITVIIATKNSNIIKKFRQKRIKKG